MYPFINSKICNLLSAHWEPDTVLSPGVSIVNNTDKTSAHMEVIHEWWGSGRQRRAGKGALQAVGTENACVHPPRVSWACSLCLASFLRVQLILLSKLTESILSKYPADSGMFSEPAVLLCCQQAWPPEPGAHHLMCFFEFPPGDRPLQCPKRISVTRWGLHVVWATSVWGIHTVASIFLF